MNFWRLILKFLDAEMTTPTLYGWYHIFCLLLTAGLAVLAAWRGRRHSESKIRRTVFLTAVAVALLEVYKQVNFTFGDGSSVPVYQWYAFPWQFCSTPMYAGLLTGIFRRGRIHRSLCAYLATYCVFAGTCVMLYPATVFIDTIGINIQTMVCHGSMVVIGVYLLGSGYVKAELRTVLKALPVFLCGVILAGMMNQVAYANGITDFNMFFISPYAKCTLPVYAVIHETLPFPVNLLIYILGFSLVALVMILPAIVIRRIRQRNRITAAV